LIRNILKAEPGKILKTGTLNGRSGTSTVVAISPEEVVLQSSHTVDSPEPWFDLILASPRPLVLKRLWPQLAAFGARKIILVNASKVEKFYFSSQWVEESSVRPLLIEGAVQAGLTHIPEFSVKMQFKIFMEDELDLMFPESRRLLAHPGVATRLDSVYDKSVYPLIAIGPEGGWTDYELNMFSEHRFSRFSLGERILRSDTACISLISVLDYWRNVEEKYFDKKKQTV
jgi:16S rRNA (uracil1498-N3)-methyltransferase